MLCSSPSQNWGCFFQFYSWIFLSSISWLIWPHTLCVGGGYLHLLTIDMMKYFSKRWNIFRWRGPSRLRGRERRWPSEHHERRQQCKRRRGDHHHLETPLPGRQTIGQTFHMQQNICLFLPLLFCHSIFPTMILLFWEDVSAAALISLVPIMPHFLGGAPNMLWTTPRYEA